MRLIVAVFRNQYQATMQSNVSELCDGSLIQGTIRTMYHGLGVVAFLYPLNNSTRRDCQQILEIR